MVEWAVRGQVQTMIEFQARGWNYRFEIEQSIIYGCESMQQVGRGSTRKPFSELGDVPNRSGLDQ